ncbi:hypothetical protein VTJ49DRAFT_6919 [Mycothermus thermophilus]|uniref:Uncharacterized protein n=1 Tax=Humicola insolens TaxID=85995 RepID=A0ABR3V1U8_HUMIN
MTAVLKPDERLTLRECVRFDRLQEHAMQVDEIGERAGIVTGWRRARFHANFSASLPFEER